jgi:hypothetical protein
MWCACDGLITAQSPAEAQERTGGAGIAPVVVEETLPEEPGACNLRITGAYRAVALQPETATPRAQLFCGFTSRFGGEIAAPLARGTEEGHKYGLGDVGLAAKYLLREGGGISPALVAGLETEFPTGNPARGTGERGTEFHPYLAVLIHTRRVIYQGNAGFAVRHTGAAREFRPAYAAAAALPVHRSRLALLGEWSRAYTPEGAATFVLSPGIHYSAGKGRYFAFALPFATGGAPRRMGAVIQFQMRVHGGGEAE